MSIQRFSFLIKQRQGIFGWNNRQDSQHFSTHWVTCLSSGCRLFTIPLSIPQLISKKSPVFQHPQLMCILVRYSFSQLTIPRLFALACYQMDCSILRRIETSMDHSGIMTTYDYSSIDYFMRKYYYYLIPYSDHSNYHLDLLLCHLDCLFDLLKTRILADYFENSHFSPSHYCNSQNSNNLITDRSFEINF